MAKPAVSPPRRPRDELGVPENADKREENGSPKNAVSISAWISHSNAWFHLTTDTGKADFYLCFNFIQHRLFRGNQRVCLSHSTRPALKPTQPPAPDVVKVL